MMPEAFRWFLDQRRDDFLEAQVERILPESEAPSFMEAAGYIMDEINAVVDQLGGDCHERGAFGPDHVPFADKVWREHAAANGVDADAVVATLAAQAEAGPEPVANISSANDSARGSMSGICARIAW
jgi:hypothetical protein